MRARTLQRRPPVTRDMLSSLAAYELLRMQRRQKAAAAEEGAAGSRRRGADDVARTTPPREPTSSSSPNLQRLTAYRRAFKKASLRWHPDKFEGRFGALLCRDELDYEGRGGGAGGVRMNHHPGAPTPPVGNVSDTKTRLTKKNDHDGGREDREEGDESTTHADAIRRRVRIISQSINEAWSAVSSCRG